MKHKWHKEIKAWANGAEIEQRNIANIVDDQWGDWFLQDYPEWEIKEWFEYRIKPQPKEPQYLYVWSTEIGIALTEPKDKVLSGYEYIGKIKLESNDD